jgi:hypothetical protein
MNLGLLKGMEEYRLGCVYGPVALDDEEANEPALVG